jgi:GntR family transcriptional repressor for pyruvate dehydrogenase complex
MTAATVRFEPISRRTISEEIRDVLVDKIRSGEMAPGAQLPSERELCDQFGVARTSVREAVQGLVTLGLLEKRGNRSHVVEHLPDVNFDHDKRKRRVRELFEVRQVVEVPIARIASERATEAQRAEILALADGFTMELSITEFRRRDRAFHTAIARACGNDVLAELHSKVLDTLFHSGEFDELLNADENRRAVRDLIRDACASHRAIARGIADGEVTDAVTAAEAHLDTVEHQMISKMV